MMNVQFTQILTSLVVSITILLLSACSRTQITQVPLTTPTHPVPVSTSPPSARATTSASISAAHVVDLIDDNTSLQTLAHAIDKADLENTLEEGGPYTIFAPSDRAFAALSAATREHLLQAENRTLLRQILTYHMISGQIYANQLQSGDMVTEAGSSVNISVDGSQVKVNEAQIVESDFKAANGIVHIVDRIILPPDINLTPTNVWGGSQIALESTFSAATTTRYLN